MSFHSELNLLDSILNVNNALNLNLYLIMLQLMDVDLVYSIFPGLHSVP